MSSYQGFNDARIKHLELVQAVIGRLGHNGFLIKGWAVTVAGAFFGFAVNSTNWRLALVGMLPTGAFWGLDAYFLRSERLFRELYSRISAQDESVAPFYMSATESEFTTQASPGVSSYWATAFMRPALSGFYGPILVAALIVMFVVLIGGAERCPA